MMRNLAKREHLDYGVHVIKLYKPDCGPCRLYAPVFKRAEAQKPDLNFYEVDVVQEPEIQDKLGVQSVPTTIILKNGEEVARYTGAMSSRMLDNFLEGR